MTKRVILMLRLRECETGQRANLSDDGPREAMRGGQLRDVRVGEIMFRRRSIEHRRAVLGSCVRTLPIARGRIVRDKNKYVEQLPVIPLRRRVHDLNGLDRLVSWR